MNAGSFACGTHDPTFEHYFVHRLRRYLCNLWMKRPGLISLLAGSFLLIQLHAEGLLSVIDIILVTGRIEEDCLA